MEDEDEVLEVDVLVILGVGASNFFKGLLYKLANKLGIWQLNARSTAGPCIRFESQHGRAQKGDLTRCMAVGFRVLGLGSGLG